MAFERVLFGTLALAMMSASPVWAQETDSRASLNLLVANPSYAGCGDPQYDFDSLACSELSSVPVGGFQTLWVVANRVPTWPNGIGSVQFGWEHDGLTFGGHWNFCTGGTENPQEVDGEWPESGTGNDVTWPGGCYVPAAETARIGFVYIVNGETGAVQLTGDPRLGSPELDARYTDCAGTPYGISEPALAGGALADGIWVICPTPAIPTQEATWTGLKYLY